MGLPCFSYPKEDSYMRVCPQIMLTTPGAFAFGQALIRDASMSAFHSVWVDELDSFCLQTKNCLYIEVMAVTFINHIHVWTSINPNIATVDG